MLIIVGKSAVRVEPDSMERLLDNPIVRVNILPRKSAKLNPKGTRTVTDTRSRVEYTKALE